MPGDVSADAILKRYDFIGTTERFTESVILLKHKLPLPMPVSLGDILYLSSKNSSKNSLLLRTKPYAQQSQRVRNFFDSKAFRDVNSIDFALWHAANQMLDRQGSAFGRGRLEQEAAEYQRLLAEADDKCYVANMYDVNRDCLLEDEACGISCLNRIAAMQQGTGPDMAAANMSAAVADIPLSSAVQNASNSNGSTVAYLWGKVVDSLTSVSKSLPMKNFNDDKRCGSVKWTTTNPVLQTVDEYADLVASPECRSWRFPDIDERVKYYM